ncbi:hypothetical protein J2T12_003953 [Paenibacillus anaericanus]|uniref:hypothetical protein n=1 Tax=Paenibacillus anaericanus TaxID=170367 RepID=UPI00278270F0|nr:hypothetical protein [Paenibacillus anaericanus]MDQ0090530.1 hypothetical protein [Paenibacillus anaericanus]
MTKYANGDPAIILHKDEVLYQSSDQIVMSVSLDGIEEGEVAIRNNDRHAGKFEFLVEQGIILPKGKNIQSGFVSYPVGELVLH